MQTQSTVKGLGKLLIFLRVFIALGSGLGVLAAVLVLMFAKLKANEVPTALMACASLLHLIYSKTLLSIREISAVSS